MKNPVGILKAKSTAYCTICQCSTRRNLRAFVYENTDIEIQKAKDEIAEKAAKKYTCNICKSILKSA